MAVSRRVACAIALLCKAPIPGYAKTRLIPLLGAKGAAEVQRNFVRRSVHTALAAAVGPLTVWCDPDASDPLFIELAQNYPLTLRSQPPGDLGIRMKVCAAATLKNAKTVIIIGADCPVMTPAYLQQAAAAMNAGTDAVIGPAEDGGYVLLATKRANKKLFTDISWGNHRVLDETKNRIRALNWHSHQLDTLWDVDRPEDWERWQRISPK